MTPNPRQRRLLDLVRAQRSASVDALSQALGVTPQTVRRDARLLRGAGLLARFHGGVALPEPGAENIAYGERQSINADGKRRIARALAARVPEGCSLILNIGTTTEAVARALARHRGLRVVTNNLNVAAILADNADSEVIVAGGIVRPRDRGIVGEAAVEFIRQFKVDIAVIGISGIEPDGTLRDFDWREVRVAQAIIAQAREVWLVADHTKFGRHAMVELAHVSQVDALYTDAPPPEPLAAVLRQARVRCEIAPAADPDRAADLSDSAPDPTRP